MVFNGCGHFGKQLGHACIKSTTHDLQRAFKWYLEKYVGFVNFFFFLILKSCQLLLYM